jgi:hypothetical protein
MMTNEHDRLLLALDFVAEAAHTMVSLATCLAVSACAADHAAVEADLWRLRRALVTAIETWREVVPGHDEGGAK